MIPTRDPAIETKAQKKLKRELEKYPCIKRYDFSKLELLLLMEFDPKNIADSLFTCRDFIQDAMGAIHDNKVETRVEFGSLYYALYAMERMEYILKKVEKTAYTKEVES